MVEEDEAPKPEVVFLQLLLAAGYISERSLTRQILELNHKLPQGSQRTFDQIRHEANEVFDAIGMDFVEVHDDFENGEVYFALRTHEPFPLFLNKTVMSPSHALQLKGILEHMLASDRCEGIPVEELPVSQFPAKHEIIASFLAEKRFVYVGGNGQDPDHPDNTSSTGLVLQDERPRVFIGTRLLSEIDSYLVEEYGDKTLLKCLGCEAWLLQGRLCANEECPARLHDRCYDAYFSSRGTRPGICPLCSHSI